MGVVLAAVAVVFGGVVSIAAGLHAAIIAIARISGIFLTSIGVHPLRRAAKVYSSAAMCPVVAPSIAGPGCPMGVGLPGKRMRGVSGLHLIRCITREASGPSGLRAYASGVLEMISTQ
ncbi:hypothetical protein LMG920_20915 [Xanthomonas vesicatoria]|nr:hypothetical protein LMG920_20915 [Xanthomonas vesicatoria]